MCLLFFSLKREKRKISESHNFQGDFLGKHKDEEILSVKRYDVCDSRLSLGYLLLLKPVASLS